MKIFCAKLKLDILVIFPNRPKFTHLLLTDLKHFFFKVYFFNRFIKVATGRVLYMCNPYRRDRVKFVKDLSFNGVQITKNDIFLRLTSNYKGYCM